MTAKTSKNQGNLVVLGAEGEARTLSDFWEHRPAVLAFLRHFG